MTCSNDDMFDYIIENCVDGVYAADPCNPPEDHPMRWVAEVLVKWCNQHDVTPPKWRNPKENLTGPVVTPDGSCGDT